MLDTSNRKTSTALKIAGIILAVVYVLLLVMFKGFENLSRTESQGRLDSIRGNRARSSQVMENFQIDRCQILAEVVPAVEWPFVITDDNAVGKSGGEHRLIEHCYVSPAWMVFQLFQKPFQESTQAGGHQGVCAIHDQ